MEKIPEATEDCPICLETVKMGLMTPCRHRFCGDCILEVWRKSQKIAAISCPYCRQEVTHLVPSMSEEERNTKESREEELRSRVLEEAERYKRELQDIPNTTERQRLIEEHIRNLDLRQMALPWNLRDLNTRNNVMEILRLSNASPYSDHY